jgi:hypothetical protein
MAMTKYLTLVIYLEKSFFGRWQAVLARQEVSGQRLQVPSPKAPARHKLVRFNSSHFAQHYNEVSK